MTLVLDGKAIRVHALVVLVANGPYWGYSVPLAPDAKVDDHRFDAVKPYQERRVVIGRA